MKWIGPGRALGRVLSDVLADHIATWLPISGREEREVRPSKRFKQMKRSKQMTESSHQCSNEKHGKRLLLEQISRQEVDNAGVGGLRPACGIKEECLGAISR